jgi:hypothetical protein
MMSPAKIMEDFTAVLGLPPVERTAPGSYIFHLQVNHPRDGTETEMTADDWDKFEKAIADAFERVP